MKHALPLPERRVLRPDEAAQYLGYDGASGAFYDYLSAIGVKPLRRGAYDKLAIDRAIDMASGLTPKQNFETVNYG